MISKIEIKWFYISALIVLVGTLGAIFFNFYYTPLVAIGLLLIWLLINKPIYYALLIAFLTPLSVQVSDIGMGGLGISLPTEPMIMALYGLLVINFFISKQINISIFKHPFTWIVTGFLIWTFITSCTSTMVSVSLKYAFMRSWYIIIFFYLLFNVFNNVNYIKIFLWCMIISTLILVIYTLSRHAAEGFVRSHSYNIMLPFFPDHGIYAAAITMFVSILMIFLFQSNEFNFSFFTKILLLVFLTLLLFGIIVSFTRAAWLSLVAAFLVYIVLKMRISFKTLIITLCIASTLSFVYWEKIEYALEHNKQGSDDDIEGHIQSVSNITTDPSNLERINRWNCALQMIKEKPIMGFGPGTYTFQYGQFQQSHMLTLISVNDGSLGNVHSEYFSALSESGIIGFILWLGIVLGSLQMAIQVIYFSQNKQHSALALGLILGLVTYYFHALLNNYTEFDKIAVPMWGFISAITALNYLHTKNKKSKINHVN